MNVSMCRELPEDKVLGTALDFQRSRPRAGRQLEVHTDGPSPSPPYSAVEPGDTSSHTQSEQRRIHAPSGMLSEVEGEDGQQEQGADTEETQHQDTTQPQRDRLGSTGRQGHSQPQLGTQSQTDILHSPSRPSTFSIAKTCMVSKALRNRARVLSWIWRHSMLCFVVFALILAAAIISPVLQAQHKTGHDFSSTTM
jgi:hypothetical protein